LRGGSDPISGGSSLVGGDGGWWDLLGVDDLAAVAALGVRAAENVNLENVNSHL
jgi:hypothetical protein